jgi:septal ring factor EnvC (AmiA/AmiB activator)
MTPALIDLESLKDRRLRLTELARQGENVTAELHEIAEAITKIQTAASAERAENVRRHFQLFNEQYEKDRGTGGFLQGEKK